jgi:predicted aconitase
MQLTRDEEAMLEGRQGPARKKAMEGLLQLGRGWSRSTMPMSMPAWRSISRMWS